MEEEKPKDTHSDGGTICPWCGLITFDEGFEDQVDNPWDCDNCERKFLVTIETKRIFTARATN